MLNTRDTIITFTRFFFFFYVFSLYEVESPLYYKRERKFSFTITIRCISFRSLALLFILSFSSPSKRSFARYVWICGEMRMHLWKDSDGLKMDGNWEQSSNAVIFKYDDYSRLK